MKQNIWIQKKNDFVDLCFNASDNAIGIWSEIFKEQSVSRCSDMINNACKSYFLGLRLSRCPQSLLLDPFQSTGYRRYGSNDPKLVSNVSPNFHAHATLKEKVHD